MDSRAVEEKILNAAFRVVDRHTISGTRMHLIAEEAKMVQSNLHYYFKTKQDLMLALLRYLQQNFSESRQACQRGRRILREALVKGHGLFHMLLFHD